MSAVFLIKCGASTDETSIPCSSGILRARRPWMYSGFSEANEQPTSNTLGPPLYLDKAQGISITLSVALAPQGKFRLNSVILSVPLLSGRLASLSLGRAGDISVGLRFA